MAKFKGIKASISRNYWLIYYWWYYRFVWKGPRKPKEFKYKDHVWISLVESFNKWYKA